MSDGDFQVKREIYDMDRYAEMRSLGSDPNGELDINRRCMDKGQKFDGEKPDYSLVEKSFLEGIAKVMTYGAKKYARNNWQLFEREEWYRYYSALIRHVEAIRAGQSIDPESGLSHFYHAACNLMMWDWLVNNKKEKSLKTYKDGNKRVSDDYPKNSSIS